MGGYRGYAMYLTDKCQINRDIRYSFSLQQWFRLITLLQRLFSLEATTTAPTESLLSII